MTKRDQPVFIYGALAAVLLLSLLKMPYGFYEFVRFAAMAHLRTWHIRSMIIKEARTK